VSGVEEVASTRWDMVLQLVYTMVGEE